MKPNAALTYDTYDFSHEPIAQLGSIGTACFTGRRPDKLYGYSSRRRYDGIMDAMTSVVTALVQASGTTTFISGGAQGGDQLGFWSVEHAKRNLRDVGNEISNVVYVPFKGQETIWDKTGLFGQDEYAKMLDMADKVTYLYGKLPDSYQKTMSLLFGRNHAMVNDSGIVIALYPLENDALSQKGGTAETIKYALSISKPIVIIDPFTCEKELRIPASNPSSV